MVIPVAVLRVSYLRWVVFHTWCPLYKMLSLVHTLWSPWIRSRCWWFPEDTTQSQQYGEVISILVPGKHSDEQNDTAVDRFFQCICNVSTLSSGVMSLFHIPTSTFLRYVSLADETWKFLMMYEADERSATLSIRTFPVEPSKSTFVDIFEDHVH